MDCPIRERLEKLTDTANSDVSIGRTIKGWHAVVALSCDDVTYQIILNGDRAMVANAASAKPDIWFSLSTKTLDALMAGTVTPLGAKLRGDIRSSGSIVNILRFASLLSAAVKSTLRAHGQAQTDKGAS